MRCKNKLLIKFIINSTTERKTEATYRASFLARKCCRTFFRLICTCYCCTLLFSSFSSFLHIFCFDFWSKKIADSWSELLHARPKHIVEGLHLDVTKPLWKQQVRIWTEFNRSSEQDMRKAMAHCAWLHALLKKNNGSRWVFWT